MENQTSPPQTGGLKLMTVFIVVLALHVAVIGGISAWHLLKGSSPVATVPAPTEENTTPKPAALAEGDDTKPAAAPGSPEVASNAAAPAVTDGAAVPASAIAGNSPVITPEETLAGDAKPAAPLNPTAPLASVKTTAPVVTESSPAGAGTYVVVKGDSLSRIAKLHGMKIADLKQMNGLKSNVLKIGQTLKIQGDETTAVADASPASTVATPGVKTASPTAMMAEKGTYVVAKGDTLTKIARHFKTTTSALMAANKLTDPTKLRIGAKLVIPTGATVRSEVTETQQPIKANVVKKTETADLVMAH